MTDAQIINLLKNYAIPLIGKNNNYDSLLEHIGDAQCVLLGEATHGTDEFYAMRAQITLELITKKGFNAVCLEADWPDAYRINQYIKGKKTDKDSMQALDNFKRFPQWMWRNTQMIEFVSKLHNHNTRLSQNKKVGIFGLDLYSLYSSIDEVLKYLDATDPAAAQRARKRYECLALYRHNAQEYGYATTFDIAASCQQKVVEQLMDLRASALELMRHGAHEAFDEYFYAEQNAYIVTSAEKYYRSLFFEAPNSSWNIRDTHMMETAQALLSYLKRTVEKPKIVIWAHNSHIGNAAATQMGWQGEINIGQLMKEKYGKHAKLVGFTTYSGTVSAASNWDGHVERKTIRPALPNSYEDLLHSLNIPQLMLLIGRDKELDQALAQERLERAIGVIYRPETERLSHYFGTQLSNQFDAIIHCDQTTALEPLEKNPAWIAGEFPETYPTGL